LHGVENRLTGIFGGPDRRVTRSRLLPAHDDGLVGLDKGVRRTFSARLRGRRLAPEIILLDGRKPGMRIGASDKAELVGIDAELGLHLEAILESGADIFEFQT